jgi:hypothetical protein
MTWSWRPDRALIRATVWGPVRTEVIFVGFSGRFGFRRRPGLTGRWVAADEKQRDGRSFKNRMNSP